MTTLTQMERTATGWKYPRCGDTREEDLLPVRAVECNCIGLERPPHPRQGWVSEEAAMAVERERLEAMAAMTPEALAAVVGVPVEHVTDAIIDAQQKLRERYPRKP